jgi:potassium/chloride transporter 9
MGYIVGNAGLLLTIGLFSLGYIVGFCTTLSQAILATNDRNMKGGGVYFLISRVFGPGIGGAFGIMYYLGDILCGTLSTLGLVEFTLENYGSVKGHSMKLLPEGSVFQMLYGLIAIFASAFVLNPINSSYLVTPIYRYARQYA